MNNLRLAAVVLAAIATALFAQGVHAQWGHPSQKEILTAIGDDTWTAALIAQSIREELRARAESRVVIAGELGR